ncbi:MAG: 50S ribosomal protein L11 methyltransferase [Desulfacinum sp.]|jgi:ribosomal protein L11 methyltransferase|nr:50S ribosomal protein L11 methyltransferase [Desulfacinum sp.]MBC7359810.1 50S ribosomal protein L11 methyltransferase [Desulfacinum sp.]MBZ4660319.1 prmA2 [Desulfacinum sp.]
MAQEKKNVKRPGGWLHVLECRGRISPGAIHRLPGCLGSWPEPPYTYLFFGRKPTGEIRRVVERAVSGRITREYALEFHQWQQPRPPTLTVGPFLITAESPGAPPGEGVLPIALKTGLVFGTGMHPTTRACLLLLDRVLRDALCREVVDLGTGTGVLALAAARLGARRVVALDVNPLAVKEAAENAALNGLEGIVFPVVGRDLQAVGMFGDLLLMNLEWPSLQGVLRRKGWRRFSRVLASGFLSAQYPKFLKYLPDDFRVKERITVDGWEAVEACRIAE